MEREVQGLVRRRQLIILSLNVGIKIPSFLNTKETGVGENAGPALNELDCEASVAFTWDFTYFVIFIFYPC